LVKLPSLKQNEDSKRVLLFGWHSDDVIENTRTLSCILALITN